MNKSSPSQFDYEQVYMTLLEYGIKDIDKYVREPKPNSSQERRAK